MLNQKSLIDVTQRPGFIFILTNPSFPNSVRIGVTTRLPVYRAAELSSSSGLPEPFKVQYSKFVEKDLHAVETRICQRLSEYIISDNRGFFELTVSEAIDEINQTINYSLLHRFGGRIYRNSQVGRWACFLEYIKVPFEYLTRPVTLNGKMTFDPNFWLPEHDLYMIVSRDLFSSKTGQLAGLYFAQKTGKVLLRFWDCEPGVEPTSNDDLIFHTGQYATPEGDIDGCIEWGFCPNCGSRHVGHLGHAELCDPASRNTSPKNCQCYNILNPHEDLMRAYRMVRHIFDGEPL